MPRSPSARTLTVASLQDLDKGKVALAINHALRRCAMDVEDRPGDKRKRTLKLSVEMTPKLDQRDGALDVIHVGFSVSVSIPTEQTQSYPMLPAKDGHLVFQPMAPNDPRQEALGFAQTPGDAEVAVGAEEEDEDDDDDHEAPGGDA